MNSTSAQVNNINDREISGNETFNTRNYVSGNIFNNENSAQQADVYLNKYENSVVPESNKLGNINELEKQCTKSFQGNDESNCQTDWQSSDAEINELCNILNNNGNRINGRPLSINPTLNNSYGPEWLSKAMFYYVCFIEFMFIFKYFKKETDTVSYLCKVMDLTPADVNRLYNSERKPNCTLCQYCCLLGCLNCCGGMMPPTPSPFSSPNNYPSKMKQTPTSATLTERQYNSLYRDFKHASQIELREQMSSRGERVESVEQEIREIIYPFTGVIFTTLVDDYLKLFEEMVKGLILLKETGITLEDICSMNEESHNHYCRRATSTMNMDRRLSTRQPYNVAEFEKLLRHELKKQYENRSNCSHKILQNSEHYTFGNMESQTCDCEQVATNNNPYLTFLTEINCHSPSSYNTEEFDYILQTEKKMFLKNCLILLRENKYFHRQSFIETDNFDVNISESGLPTRNHGQMQNTNDTQHTYNMAIKIYNQTICHVQSAILAMIRSMKYGEKQKRFLPLTPDETCTLQRDAKISESKNLIEKSLSQYLKTGSTEDKIFVNESLNGNTSGFQTLPPVTNEDEVRYLHGQYQSEQTFHEPMKSQFMQNKSCIEKAFPQFAQDGMQQHPDLEYVDDTKRHMSKRHGTIHLPDQITKTSFLAQDIPENFTKTVLLTENTQNTARTSLQQDNIGKNAQTEVKINQPHENKAANRLLFKKKNNDVRITCVLNYLKSEVSHIEAITFLKKIEKEGGSFHYPHCSENTSLIKIEGPSVYFSVTCANCRQELAPPQKLEAFKSECETTNRSKLMAYIIRKSRASFYLPVQCGGCGCFFCDPERGKKRIIVPFHSPVKGYICSARLRSHECQTSSSDTEYRGCISDTSNTSSCGHRVQKIYEKRGQSYEYLNSPNKKIMARSNSLPALLCEKDINGLVKNNANTSNYSTRRNDLLKFEDAVANILNMWTYEMINYEKGANSPQLRSQILNYRKSISIFIKRDIKEKLYYRHILSVFKRIENFESPILEIRNHDIATRTSSLNRRIIRRSRSCHSKLSYETTTGTRRSKSEYLVCNDFSAQINTFKHALSELEKDAKRPYLFNVENENTANKKHFKNSCQFKSEPLEYKNNSTHQTKCKILDFENSKASLCLKYETNRDKIARPLSLHSELKQKTSSSRRRRSCSFEIESIRKHEFSNQISAWRAELKELQKSIENPRFKTEALNRNMVRPRSLHSELRQNTLVTHSRRRSSASFATESGYKDLSPEIKAWKNELLKLENSVQSPYLGSETVNRKNVARPLSLHSDLKQETTAATHRRRSCSFAADSTCKEDFSNHINVWKNELIKLQKSVQSPHLTTVRRKSVIKAGSGFESEYTNNAVSRPKIKSVINKNSSPQKDAQEDKLMQLRKIVEDPHLPSEKENSKNTIKDSTYSTKGVTRRPSSDLINEDQFSFEMKAKDECIQLDKNVDRPYLGGVQEKRSKVARNKALNLNQNDLTPAVPRHHQTQSVINEDISTELKAWRRELLKLQESVKSPHSKSEILIRKNKRTVSLDSEPNRTSKEYRPLTFNDSLTELKTWNHKLRELEKDASSPHLRTEIRNHKMKTRAVSLHEKPKHTTASSSRPKSESVLDDFSFELNSWKHELFILEEDAVVSQPVTLNRTNPLKSRSSKSETKYKNPEVSSRVNLEPYTNKVDSSRINTWMAPVDIPFELNAHARTKGPEYKPSARRYSTTHRQLPPIPSSISQPSRRHSHYETTGNFVNLLSDRKGTRLNTHALNPTVSTFDGCRTNQALVEPQNKASDCLFIDDNGATRSRFFSQ